jgi:hypothetical protein
LAPVAPSAPRPTVRGTILLGGLAVGVLDALDATIFFGLRGVRPGRIAQHIASALLGRASFQGGIPTILLGVLLHFAVAFSIASVYYALSVRLSVMVRRPVVSGVVFGVTAFFVMNRVVLPFTRASNSPGPLPVLLNGVIGHALLVGLPIALLAARSAHQRRSGP